MREPRYRLFGRTLASSFPFTFPLPLAEGSADLAFEAVRGTGARGLGPKGHLVYESPVTDETGVSVLKILQLAEEQYLLRFPGIADFTVGPRRILCHPIPPERLDLVEVRFFGTVLAFHLEWGSSPVLHASAVAVEDAAVLFLGGNRSGKTGLAASFLRAGSSLSSDDLVALVVEGGEISTPPAYPQMRVWPDLAAFLVDSWEDLPRVIPEVEKRRLLVGGEGLGRFERKTLPVAAVYLPERRAEGGGGAADAVEVLPLKPRDAVLELLRTSFLARQVEALGWQPRRLELFARLAQQVPMRRLRYPSGFERLATVREAVLADLEIIRNRPLPSRLLPG
ncbi:MAG: hypothetical protein KDD47_10290 [Acidobacteria bacterium]|nr:hypothetical protein [Acidobacteriota bacterium]